MSSEHQLEASLLIATYNHSTFLKRTLLGLTRQTCPRFEIVICDDGSGPEVEAVLNEFRPRFRAGLIHCRQEDRGFRKCRILNEGVLEASADYLIFLDADCIPHSRFIEGHLGCRETGRYLAGRRVELGETATEALTDGDVTNGLLQSVNRWGLSRALRGELRHLEAGFYLPPWLGVGPFDRRLSLLGCNFSCWKDDLVRINGFNEDFTTPAGGEDSDIERRFKMLGLRSRGVKHQAICYHQYHPLAPNRERGVDLYRQLAAEGRLRCAHGLAEHARPGESVHDRG